MTSHERLGRYVSGLVDFEAIVRTGVSAGISQATGTPKEWGGGAEGYGLRMGNTFAQHVIRGTLQYGISAALHEDNRYFVSRQSSFSRRTMYAVKSTFFARHDNGVQAFSFSRGCAWCGGHFFRRETWCSTYSRFSTGHLPGSTRIG